MKAAAFRLMPLLAAAVLAAGCSSLNPFSSSAAKPASLQDFTPSAQLAVSWRASVGAAGDYRFQPAVWDGNVYAAGHRGEVARFDAGRQVWRADLDTRLSAGVGTDGRLAVVVATDGTVVALDAQNGAERWRAAVGAEVLAPPAVSLEFVIVRASDNRLIALDARDGSQRWVYQRNNPPLALRSFASVLIEGPVVLAGFPGGKLAVLNITNGGAITELNVALPRGATELERVADVVGTPVIGRREVCAVAYQGRAACFDTSNGNAIWAREFSSSVGMDRDARFAMITDDGDAVHALDVLQRRQRLEAGCARAAQRLTAPDRGRARRGRRLRWLCAPAESRDGRFRRPRSCRQRCRRRRPGGARARLRRAGHGRRHHRLRSTLKAR